MICKCVSYDVNMQNNNPDVKTKYKSSNVRYIVESLPHVFYMGISYSRQRAHGMLNSTQSNYLDLYNEDCIVSIYSYFNCDVMYFVISYIALFLDP